MTGTASLMLAFSQETKTTVLPLSSQTFRGSATSGFTQLFKHELSQLLVLLATFC
jgi:hypothetical protein